MNKPRWGSIVLSVWLVFVFVLTMQIGTPRSFAWFDFKLPTSAEPSNRIQRLELARALNGEIRKIYDAIPNLRPDEKRWLDDEMNSDNVNRKLKAVQSKEYTVQQAKKQVGTFKSITEMLVQGKYEDQRKEVILWLGIAAGLMSYAFSSNISELVQSKAVTIDGESRYGELNFMLFVCGAIGQHILGAIVGPYLMGQLPD